MKWRPRAYTSITCVAYAFESTVLAAIFAVNKDAMCCFTDEAFDSSTCLVYGRRPVYMYRCPRVVVREASNVPASKMPRATGESSGDPGKWLKARGRQIGGELVDDKHDLG